MIVFYKCGMQNEHLLFSKIKGAPFFKSI